MLDPLAQPKVLIACDKREEAERLTQLFESEGFHVMRSALNVGSLPNDDNQVDLIIIDTTNFGNRGLGIASRIRARSIVGLIIVHHPDDRLDPVDGFDVGADDVIGKPFRSEELIARVKSVIRRVRHQAEVREGADRGGRIRFDGWVLHVAVRVLESHEGLRVALTGAEYDLLLAFLRHPGRVLSRDQILMMTKGRAWKPSDRSLDTLVVRLRRKLGGNGDAALIKPVRHVGYVFCVRTSDVVFEPAEES